MATRAEHAGRTDCHWFVARQAPAENLDADHDRHVRVLDRLIAQRRRDHGVTIRTLGETALGVPRFAADGGAAARSRAVVALGGQRYDRHAVVALRTNRRRGADRSRGDERHMRITFTQSGGFAGLVRHIRLDTAALDAAEQREVERLVAASGLTASWERFAAAARDLKQYEIVIEGAGNAIHVCCDDRCLPEPARPLVRFLANRSRPGPPPAAPAAGASVDGDVTNASAATAGWGRFTGAVVARWHDDGRAMTLVEPFGYVDPRAVEWDAAAGAVVDGASIPRPFWSLIGGPFEGRFRYASVVHDVACMERTRDWRDVHRMFHDACRCGGVGAALANTMYYAVWHFGPRWRFEDRRGIVAGHPVVERVPIAEPVPEPAPELVRQAADWFATHDVDADMIPTLPIPPR